MTTDVTGFTATGLLSVSLPSRCGRSQRRASRPAANLTGRSQPSTGRSRSAGNAVPES